MTPDINSPQEYSHLLIKTILDSERAIPEEQQMPINLLTYLTQYIEDYVEQKWDRYLIGTEETFMLNDVEMEALFNKAGEQYAQDLINDLVDKDMLETYIGEDGEILYGLSELGKQISEKYKNDETNK